MSGDQGNTSDNFFKKLRKIARHVEHSVEDLKKSSESEHGTQSHMNVAKKLLDLRKDVKKLKVDGTKTLENLYRDGNEHSAIINLCNSLIDKQRKRLESIEAFYQQYGYIKKDMKPETHIEEKKEAKKKEEEEVDSEEKVDDKSVKTPPHKENVKPKVYRTPKLEDFGLSQFTLDRLARAEKMNEPFSYVEEIKRKPEPKNDDIPKIFQHNGLFMTPSVLGGKTSLQTPDHNHKHISQFSSPVWTPLDDQSHAKDMTEFNQQVDAKLNLFANYNETESPVPPPKPQTKEMYRQNVTSSKSMTNYSSISSDVKSSSSVSYETSYKHLSGNTATSYGSQDVVLAAKKQNSTKSDFSKSILSKFPKMKINASVLDEDNEPKRPELTVDLSSITGIYRQTVTSSTTVSEPAKPASINTGTTSAYRVLDIEPEAPELTINFKDLRTREHFFSPVQKEFKPMAEKYGTHKTEDKTPPVPELFSDRLNQKRENGDSNTTGTPPPPKLMGNYSFLRKSAFQENVPPN